jgi:replicative DNA helicase
VSQSPQTELERAVLGCALIYPERTHLVAALTEEHFTIEQHREVLRSIQDLCERSAHVDELTIQADLTQKGSETVGAIFDPMVVQGSKTSQESFHAHLLALSEARARQLLAAKARSLASASISSEKKPSELIAQMMSDILEIETGETVGPRLIRTIIEGQDITDLVPAKGKSEATRPTGFYDLDKILDGGMRDGELWLIGARPSVGKTTIGMNIAQYAAQNNGEVLIFSLEMTALALIQRMICSTGPVDFGKFRSAALSEEERADVRRALGVVANLPMWIDDRASLSAEEIFAQTKKLTSIRPITLVLVDYLQLMTLKSSKRNDSRNNDLGGITGILKRISKECNCTVIALSQLSRDPEKRKGKDKRPRLSDLRDSGAIEQDADVVLFPERPILNEPDNTSLATVAHLQVGKQRNGPLGKVELVFEGEYVRFLNADTHHEDGEFV